MRALTKQTQFLIRRIHLAGLSSPLPRRIGLYLHEIEGHHWTAFREMATYFRDAGYRFVGPDEFLAEAEARVVFLSFDDNYRSFLESLPLLKETGVQATFYVNTCAFRGLASEPQIEAYFDRLGFRGRRVPLSVEELRDIASSGHVIGAHGHTHRRLTALAPNDARSDILTSKQTLEELLGQEVIHFAYPFGLRRHFSEDLRGYCSEIGFRTIANAIPALQFAQQAPERIQRSGWDLSKSLTFNCDNLRVDGRIFETLTGRSAVG